jgi:hypothetical protein
MSVYASGCLFMPSSCSNVEQRSLMCNALCVEQLCSVGQRSSNVGDCGGIQAAEPVFPIWVRNKFELGLDSADRRQRR